MLAPSLYSWRPLLRGILDPPLLSHCTLPEILCTSCFKNLEKFTETTKLPNKCSQASIKSCIESQAVILAFHDTQVNFSAYVHKIFIDAHQILAKMINLLK